MFATRCRKYAKASIYSNNTSLSTALYQLSATRLKYYKFHNFTPERFHSLPHFPQRYKNVPYKIDPMEYFPNEIPNQLFRLSTPKRERLRIHFKTNENFNKLPPPVITISQHTDRPTDHHRLSIIETQSRVSESLFECILCSCVQYIHIPPTLLSSKTTEHSRDHATTIDDWASRELLIPVKLIYDLRAFHLIVHNNRR